MMSPQGTCVGKDISPFVGMEVAITIEGRLSFPWLSYDAVGSCEVYDLEAISTAAVNSKAQQSSNADSDKLNISTRDEIDTKNRSVWHGGEDWSSQPGQGGWKSYQSSGAVANKSANAANVLVSKKLLVAGDALKLRNNLPRRAEDQAVGMRTFDGAKLGWWDQDPPLRYSIRNSDGRSSSSAVQRGRAQLEDMTASTRLTLKNPAAVVPEQDDIAGRRRTGGEAAEQIRPQANPLLTKSTQADPVKDPGRHRDSDKPEPVTVSAPPVMKPTRTYSPETASIRVTTAGDFQVGSNASGPQIPNPARLSWKRYNPNSEAGDEVYQSPEPGRRTDFRGAAGTVRFQLDSDVEKSDSSLNLKPRASTTYPSPQRRSHVPGAAAANRDRDSDGAVRVDESVVRSHWQLERASSRTAGAEMVNAGRDWDHNSTLPPQASNLKALSRSDQTGAAASSLHAGGTATVLQVRTAVDSDAGSANLNGHPDPRAPSHLAPVTVASNSHSQAALSAQAAAVAARRPGMAAADWERPGQAREVAKRSPSPLPVAGANLNFDIGSILRIPHQAPAQCESGVLPMAPTWKIKLESDTGIVVKPIAKHFGPASGHFHAGPDQRKRDGDAAAAASHNTNLNPALDAADPDAAPRLSESPTGPRTGPGLDHAAPAGPGPRGHGGYSESAMLPSWSYISDGHIRVPLKAAGAPSGIVRTWGRLNGTAATARRCWPFNAITHGEAASGPGAAAPGRRSVMDGYRRYKRGDVDRDVTHDMWGTLHGITGRQSCPPGEPGGSPGGGKSGGGGVTRMPDPTRMFQDRTLPGGVRKLPGFI